MNNLLLHEPINSIRYSLMSSRSTYSWRV